MAKSFQSSFLEAFKILPWDSFDDGASGNVFKVEGKRGKASPVRGIDVHDLQFIVKLVKLPSSSSTELPTKVMREVELLETNGIEDENVVKIFGSWEENPPIRFEYPNRPPINEDNARILFILMEYCDLFTLRRWLGWPREKKSWNDLLNLFVQVTKGLICIHERRIIHRDLKPSNIGLKCDWKEERVIAKLIDFGLATEFRDVMTSKVGTHLYRSPESHQHGGLYNEKADIYALGIILCQMMASLAAMDANVAKLEEEFRQFVEETMNSSDSTYTPVPFDASTYLQKYRVQEDDVQVCEMIKLAGEMTSQTPQDRPSSVDVMKKVKIISPDAEKLTASIYNYLEEVKEKQVCLSAMNCTSLRPIVTSRLNHLTHLTLKNIQVTKKELLETCQECFCLKHLSLSLRISDSGDEELLSMDSIRLPHLQTFRLRLIGSSTNIDSSKLKSLLFFGPMSQIWEKKMRVKISKGKLILMDIDAREKMSFFLKHTFGGFDFLEILNHVPFQEVSLIRLNGKSHEDILDLHESWSLEKRMACSSFYLWCGQVKDFQDGRLFQSFSCLKELTLFGAFGLPFNVIQFDLLPPTITKLELNWICSCIDGMSETTPRKLEILHLCICEVPRSFYENYDRIFEVEDLKVLCVTRGSTISVTPGFSYVETFLNTSNWKTVILDPFDWIQTPENSKFRMDFISSFFSTEDEKSLKDQGIALEWIDGNAVARLLVGVPVNERRLPVKGPLDPIDPVDSDDEEANLMIQQGALDHLEIFRPRKVISTVVEDLDNDLSENFCFKGTSSNPSYPQQGWRMEDISFEKFVGIKKHKADLRHIQLRNCKIGSSLPIQLHGCLHLQSLILEMVELEENVLTKITTSFPHLKTYVVNLYSRSIPGINTTYFTFDSLDQLFFFRQRPERINGLWESGICCKISVQGSLFLEMNESSLSLEFLPDVNRILSLVGLNENLKTLKLHCCLITLPHQSLPTSITKLTLKYVSVALSEVSPAQFPNLKTLVFEGHGVDTLIDWKHIERIPTLEHLTLCNISMYDEPRKLQVALKSCTFNRVYSPETFNSVGYLSSESVVLADGFMQCVNFETLYSLLNSETISVRDVTFINCERDVEKERPARESEDYVNGIMSSCQSFLSRHEIVGNSFRVDLNVHSHRTWKAVEIFPDESDDPLLEGYRETKPYFPEKDEERRNESFKRLRDPDARVSTEFKLKF